MSHAPRHRGQEGYTLIELILASSIGLIVMTGLTSAVLTSMKAANTATSRIEASSQIRNFQMRAMDDFAQSAVPATSDPAQIRLVGTKFSASGAQAATVDYVWDSGTKFIDRQGVHLSSNVTNFSWYVDRSTVNPTVVVNVTVTVLSYSESQIMRFYPRINP
jgi:prepilin-type N-terminal cleavage/methylation domain-containing protein